MASTAGPSSSSYTYARREDLTEGIPLDVITCDGPNCQQTAPSKRCPSCFTAYYCSVDCQKRAWKDHQLFCTPLDVMIEKQKELRPMESITDILRENGLEMTNRSSSTITTEKRQKDGATRRQSNEEDAGDPCHICLSGIMKDPITMKNCKHSFCCNCIMTWQAKSKERHHFMEATQQRQRQQETTDIHDNNRPTKASSTILACPVCREEMENLEESLLSHAISLATEANIRTLSEDDRMILRKEALSYANKVLDIPNCSIQAHFSKANILLSMRSYQKALEAIEELLDENKRRDNHPVLLLIQNKAETFDEGDSIETSERLQEEVLAAAQQHGMPATRIGSDHLFDVYVIQSEAYQGLEKWKEAMDSYEKAMLALDGPNSPPAIDQRKLFMGLAECAYKVKEYENAIAYANAAIEMNRHFPGIHRLKALALEKVGRLDEAIVTMNRAVLYETPWDEENQQNVLALYNDLRSKMASSS